MRLETHESLEPLEEEWRALAERSGNVFATWEWASTWWRHFGEGGRLAVVACRDAAGRLVAILPFYRSTRGPLRQVRFLGHGPADELGPVCAPEDRPAATEALREALRGGRLGSYDVFLGEELRADLGWGAAVGARTLRSEGSPILRFEGRTWEEYLGTRSRNFRGRIRRDERRTIGELGGTFRGGGDDLERDLDLLRALHSARWDEDVSPFAREREHAFHRDFARAAHERGWLRLWFLELDRTPVAAWYGFRFGDAESYYQAGRDRSYDHASVGFVLLVHTMREACGDGVAEYRFLRGGEGYKYRFATHDPGLETVVRARTLRGRAGVFAARALLRVRGRKAAAAGAVGDSSAAGATPA